MGEELVDGLTEKEKEIVDDIEAEAKHWDKEDPAKAAELRRIGEAIAAAFRKWNKS